MWPEAGVNWGHTWDTSAGHSSALAPNTTAHQARSLLHPECLCIHAAFAAAPAFITSNLVTEDFLVLSVSLKHAPSLVYPLHCSWKGLWKKLTDAPSLVHHCFRGQVQFFNLFLKTCCLSGRPTTLFPLSSPCVVPLAGSLLCLSFKTNIYLLCGISRQHWLPSFLLS